MEDSVSWVSEHPIFLEELNSGNIHNLLEFPKGHGRPQLGKLRLNQEKRLSAIGNKEINLWMESCFPWVTTLHTAEK